VTDPLREYPATFLEACLDAGILFNDMLFLARRPIMLQLLKCQIQLRKRDEAKAARKPKGKRRLKVV
jgi:hypothetical protein